jgi:hypothetical protein
MGMLFPSGHFIVRRYGALSLVLAQGKAEVLNPGTRTEGQGG